MFWRTYVCALLLTASILGAESPVFSAQPTAYSQLENKTTVRLRWGARPGVYRYRLQLARDPEFADIVFDRVITGNEIAIDDLLPGRYFWRVAALTTEIGVFSSAAPIEVRANDVSNNPTGLTNQTINASRGWRAAIGYVTRPESAHLRSRDIFDVVCTNDQGVTFALDAMTGVALWSVRPVVKGPGHVTSLPISSISGSDNVLSLQGTLVLKLEGATGRLLWRASLPSVALAAAVVTEKPNSRIVVIDSSLRRLYILNDLDGALLAEFPLPARVLGQPVAVNRQKRNQILLAYETGAVEIRDSAGNVIRSGSAGSVITTAPIFVPAASGGLVLVGTQAGLTAMTADDLRPLGRVALKDDVPRGTLVSVDLNGDGAWDIIMTTSRRHLVAVNAADGKIIWDVPSVDDVVSYAFADINGDRVSDVLMPAPQAFAVALSGRDGSVIWKDAPETLVANHATTSESRGVVAVPSPSGVLVIGPDPSQAGLRAIEFLRSSIRPNRP